MPHSHRNTNVFEFERDNKEKTKETNQNSDAPVKGNTDNLVVLQARRRAECMFDQDAYVDDDITAQQVSRQSTEISEQIGKGLRGLYDDVVSQAVPERFLELLNQLETGTISKDKTSTVPKES